MEVKLRELGIPYTYIGEYVESSPLGKAEWVVAIAEIAGCRAEEKNSSPKYLHATTSSKI